MTQLANDFETLGFWEDETDEEHIVIYGMDFPSENAYIIVTDDSGKTPATNKDTLVIACYDNDDCFLWGKELQNWFALEKLVTENKAETKELLEALKAYTLPKKKNK